MFDFIPLQLYSPIYYCFVGGILFISFLNTQTKNLLSKSTVVFNRNASSVLLLFVIIYMGFRPINGTYFGDMATYAYGFKQYQQGGISVFKADIVFDSFIWLCSKIMTVDYFFLICTVIYVVPLWLASKKWFGQYAFYSFLALLISFSFWSYGTNGIRNGLATSVFIYALSRDKLGLKIVFFLLSVGIHKAMVIPAVAFGITYLVKDPKWYFYVWLTCIPLSLVTSGFWENLFSAIMQDSRVSYLTRGNISNENFSSTGFRWDFLLYSGAAIYVAYFFIFKKKFADKYYTNLVGTYIIANAFWILVIRANFSNRFAYLSWFMMALVIFYPFLTKIQIKNQHRILGLVLLAYFSFTILMNVILNK